jgi:hypothetical protein
VKGNLEDEGKLRTLIDKLKNSAYVFTQVIDERDTGTVVLSSVSEVDPMKAIEEYLDKSKDARLKKLRERILEEARNILGELNA